MLTDVKRGRKHEKKLLTKVKIDNKHEGEMLKMLKEACVKF